MKQYTKQDIIEFTKWRDTPIFRRNGELGFKLRVQPQFPDYDSYYIIDNKGWNVLPEGTFLTADELFEYWIEDKINTELIKYFSSIKVEDFDDFDELEEE